MSILIRHRTQLTFSCPHCSLTFIFLLVIIFDRKFIGSKSPEISNSEYDTSSSGASNFSSYQGPTLNSFKQENSGAPDVLAFVRVHERCKDPFALMAKVRT
jgi:hypothetical protein